MTTDSLARSVRGLGSALTVLLVWGCHSEGKSRDAALDLAQPDQAQAADKNAPAEVARTTDSSSVDTQPDIATGIDILTDVGGDPAAGDSRFDSLQDGGGTFRCNFPADPTTLFCNEGQYCRSLHPGAVGYEPTYSCVSLPAACAGNGSCDCVCGSGGASNCRVASVHCLCISGPDGLVLVCSAP